MPVKEIIARLEIKMVKDNCPVTKKEEKGSINRNSKLEDLDAEIEPEH